jgi:hypothetical protein
LKKVKSDTYLSILKNGDHALLRRHPVSCGVLQYDMFHDIHRYGFQLEWATDCIRPMIYLYIATRLLDPDSRSWPDMELLILRQDPTRLFYGLTRPVSSERAFLVFELACGKDVYQIGDDIAHDPQSQYTSEPDKPIIDPSILGDVFLERFNRQVDNNRDVDSVVRDGQR